MGADSLTGVAAARRCGFRVKRPPLTDAQSRLAAAYFPLARKLARPLKDQFPYLWDEIDSAVGLAIVEAAQTFDPSRNIKFLTFARYRIWGALRDVLRGVDFVQEDMETGKSRHVKTSQLSFHQAEYGWVLNTTPDGPVGSECSAIETVIKMSSWLPPRHGEIIRLIYIRGLTHAAVGSIMGCSESRVGHMHREAIAMYRGPEAIRDFYARDAKHREREIWPM